MGHSYKGSTVPAGQTSLWKAITLSSPGTGLLGFALHSGIPPQYALYVSFDSGVTYVFDAFLNNSLTSPFTATSGLYFKLQGVALDGSPVTAQSLGQLVS
jgi:hypothetical protein